MGTTDGEILALGLWLPCGQANFFHSSGDKELIPTNFHESPLLPLKKNKTQQEKNNQRLQCSVFRRLFEVLGSRGYDAVLPLYHKIEYDI